MPRLIPFAWSNALRDLVLPSDVVRGKGCNCVCPACGKAVQARHPKAKIVKHFAHLPGAECAHGLETVVHRAAKALLFETRKICLPEVNVDAGHPQEYRLLTIASQSVYEAARAEQEVSVGPYRVDVMFFSGSGRRLVIEVVVTADVNPAKEEFFANQHISALKIDLSRNWKSTTPATLRAALFANTAMTNHWIFNAYAVVVAREIALQAKNRSVVWRPGKRGRTPTVPSCPLALRSDLFGRFADAKEDCPKCWYFWQENGYGPHVGRTVRCVGHLASKFPHGYSDWVSSCQQEVGRQQHRGNLREMKPHSTKRQLGF